MVNYKIDDAAESEPFLGETLNHFLSGGFAPTPPFFILT